MGNLSPDLAKRGAMWGKSRGERRQRKGPGESVCIREEQAWKNGEEGERRDQPHVGKLLVGMLGWSSPDHFS